jgi:hypothetical protein
MPTAASSSRIVSQMRFRQSALLVGPGAGPGIM